MKEKEGMHTNHYLFNKFGDLIEERGIIMVDYHSSMFVNNEEYISPYSVIALCHKGCLDCEYDLKPVAFHSQDIAIMRPGHVIKNISASADYSAQLIITSSSSLNSIRQQHLNHHLATHKFFDIQPCQHLTNEQYRLVRDAFSLIRTACNIVGVHRSELISSTFHTLMVLLSSFRQEQIMEQHNAGYLLSQQFNEAVIEHYRRSREVGFYARMFHLSPKYFSTLIKQETGISASKWIDRYVVLQSKALLKQQCDLSIQRIAEEMGFSEQASFSRFFKKQTGFSPTEYRDKKF